MVIYPQNIHGITLLSVQEAAKISKQRRRAESWWWLRSPGTDPHRALLVANNGTVHLPGADVDISFGSVRPALRVSVHDPEFRIGSRAELFGYSWTKITKDLLLCDKFIGETAFCKSLDAPRPNDYETSDIKTWLEHWLAAQPEIAAFRSERRALHDAVSVLWA